MLQGGILFVAIVFVLVNLIVDVSYALINPRIRSVVDVVAELEATRASQLEAPSGLWSDAWRRLRRNPGAIVGFVLVALFVVVAVFAPLIAPYGPREQDLRRLLATAAARARRASHWFGVDQLGRDEFSRIVYGARYSLLIGVVSVAVGLSLGLSSARSPATSAGSSTR